MSYFTLATFSGRATATRRREGPMVRIRLPPGESHANHQFLPPGKEPMLTDGCGAPRDVDETGCGARFSQLVADRIFAEKLPAGMSPGQQRPTKGMAAR